MRARDHGIEPRDLFRRKLPHPWHRTCEECYRYTVLRHQEVDGAFEAVAQGIVVCREYDEMRLPSLRAVADGIRQTRQ